MCSNRSIVSLCFIHCCVFYSRSCVLCLLFRVRDSFSLCSYQHIRCVINSYPWRHSLAHCANIHVPVVFLHTHRIIFDTKSVSHMKLEQLIVVSFNEITLELFRFQYNSIMNLSAIWTFNGSINMEAFYMQCQCVKIYLL